MKTETPLDVLSRAASLVQNDGNSGTESNRKDNVLMEEFKVNPTFIYFTQPEKKAKKEGKIEHESEGKHFDILGDDPTAYNQEQIIRAIIHQNEDSKDKIHVRTPKPDEPEHTSKAIIHVHSSTTVRHCHTSNSDILGCTTKSIIHKPTSKPTMHGHTATANICDYSSERKSNDSTFHGSIPPGAVYLGVKHSKTPTPFIDHRRTTPAVSHSKCILKEITRGYSSPDHTLLLRAGHLSPRYIPYDKEVILKKCFERPSVEDHFRKSLGEQYDVVSENSLNAPNELKLKQSDTAKNQTDCLSNEVIVDRYITTACVEIEKPSSVDEHFLKALGKKWYKLAYESCGI